MSRNPSKNPPLVSLQLITSAFDSDNTNSSTSSGRATNSVSLSPTFERDSRTSLSSVRASNHLLELQREIKEEEEEIFADINSLINSRSILYRSDSSDYDGEASGSASNDQQDLHLYWSNDDPTDEFLRPNNSNNSRSSNYNNNNTHYLQDFIDENDEQDNGPENDSRYISEHEFVSCRPKDQQNYQDIQGVIKQVTNNLPKPCVFFLEGNCRRSDCKYSHDLSNITCKYWIEGFCFKGEMCPFLHSYNSTIDSQDSSLLDDDGLEALKKKQLNPTFVIESEADFPSLPLDAPVTSLNDNIKSNINEDGIATTIKNHILSSNPAVVFKIVKKKRKRG